MEQKPIKVFWNGKRLRDIYPHATAFQVFKWRLRRFIRKVLIISFALGLLWSSFQLGGLLKPKTIITKAEVIREVESITPVLKRIAQAESLNSHYCTETLVKAKMCSSGELGQVLVRSNNNKTIDVGRYQINVFYWGKIATEQGLNIFDEKDNEKMAIWIYKNYGTEPWGASSKNW